MSEIAPAITQAYAEERRKPVRTLKEDRQRGAPRRQRRNS